MSPTIDLNADLGEDLAAAATDAALLGVVTSANIACGGHAGDEATMRATVVAAAEAGVVVGAHPSYPDRAGFGRVELPMAPGELERSLTEQLRTFRRIADEGGARIAHLKPHGALYHAAMKRPEIAALIARVAGECGDGVALVGQAGAAGTRMWQAAGHRVLAEAFADRRYELDGTLRARTKPGALLDDPKAAAEQALRIALGHGVLTGDARVVPVQADTLCVHADTPNAIAIATAVRASLEAAGVRVAAPAR